MGTGTTVYFAFNLGDKVVTNFGIIGIIESLALDDGGNKYWIETGAKETSRWYKEKFIKFAE